MWVCMMLTVEQDQKNKLNYFRMSLVLIDSYIISHGKSKRIHSLTAFLMNEITSLIVQRSYFISK